MRIRLFLFSFFLIISTLPISSLAKESTLSLHDRQSYDIKKINMRHFQTLIADGHVSILLNPNLRKSRMSTHSKMNIIKRNDQLIIKGNGRVSLAGPLNKLHSIYLSGQASIQGEHVTGNHLKIVTENKSHLQLKGLVNLTSIIAKNNSSVEIHWVNAHRLTLQASDQAHLHLAGRVGLLSAKLRQSATLDAKYLRAKSVWIQVKDNTHAKVFPKKTLRVFGNQQGLVDYYHHPKNNTCFLKKQSNAMYHPLSLDKINPYN